MRRNLLFACPTAEGSFSERIQLQCVQFGDLSNSCAERFVLDAISGPSRENAIHKMPVALEHGRKVVHYVLITNYASPEWMSIEDIVYFAHLSSSRLTSIRMRRRLTFKTTAC